ncbi:MAG: universal stress protein [Candidatus Kuenenia sp.]|nr:universal stress protein [Candidatus Kuenenia hertensis]
MITVKKILFPTDFSPCAKHALTYALSLATLFKAKLYIIHVIPKMNIPISAGGVMYPTLKIYKDMEENAKKKMHHLIPKRFLDQIEVENIIVRGTPYVEITKNAKKYNIDIITIATHGRTGISHTLIGSVAEKVVRKAPCPVLTIKHPEHEFVIPA